jgi:hypothetical protein
LVDAHQQFFEKSGHEGPVLRVYPVFSGLSSAGFVLNQPVFTPRGGLVTTRAKLAAFA